MNKSKRWILILLIILAAVAAFLIFGGRSADPAPQQAEVPGVTGEPVRADTQTEETTPAATEQQDPTVPTDASTTEPTDDPMTETGVQPESGETLPPDTKASIGVAKDDEAAGELENEDSVVTGGSQKPPQTDDPSGGAATPPAADQPSGSNPILGADFDLTALTYESYMAMTGEQQKAVIDEFSSPDVFVKWFKAVEAKYKEEHPEIEIGGNDVIDGSQIG